MGYGRWTRASFESYSRDMGRHVTTAGDLDSRYSDRQLFTQRGLHPTLNPKNVVRECRDSQEHPNTLPVILALDVTGSMGDASAQVAKKLNQVMTELYKEVQDVEFLVMGIGDLAYDQAPIQISQFESDIRIAEQLDRVWMEHGGGSNPYESYTAAWYMGLRHTRLDCLKRGRKALIITMGDEPMNPYLPRQPLEEATGDALQADVETPGLFREASEVFDLFHIHVDHGISARRWPSVEESFGRQLPAGHLFRATVEQIADTIVDIVKKHAASQAASSAIRWEVPAEKPREEKGEHRIRW